MKRSEGGIQKRKMVPILDGDTSMKKNTAPTEEEEQTVLIGPWCRLLFRTGEILQPARWKRCPRKEVNTAVTGAMRMFLTKHISHDSHDIPQALLT